MGLQERQGPIADVSTTTVEVWLSYWEEKEGRETREVAQRQLEEMLKWTETEGCRKRSLRGSSEK